MKCNSNFYISFIYRTFTIGIFFLKTSWFGFNVISIYFLLLDAQCQYIFQPVRRVRSFPEVFTKSASYSNEKDTSIQHNTTFHSISIMAESICPFNTEIKEIHCTKIDATHNAFVIFFDVFFTKKQKLKVTPKYMFMQQRILLQYTWVVFANKLPLIWP